MNERIQELGVAAGLIVEEWDGFNRRQLNPAEQKFAELIVEECVQRLRQEGQLATIQAFAGSTYKFAYMNNAANIIKQHFGVEE